MKYPLKSKELKIKVQKDLTTYLNYSLPLCAILSEDKYYPWFYQHFVQLYTLNDDEGNLWVDYLEDLDFFKDVADKHFYDYKSLIEVKDILNFIINNIDMDNYVIVFLDEYYLPHKLSYMKEHFLHQLMIYGYNEETQIFNTIAFNEDGEFKKDDYTFEQINQAYELGKNYYQTSPIWVLNETLEIIKLKETEDKYEFSLDLFLEELNTYLLGQGDYSKIRPNNLKTNGTIASFNFKVFDELIIHLNDLIQGKETMDYRYMHLLFEHKSIMHRRLEYIAGIHKPNNKLNLLLQDYKEEVVRRTLKARNLFFKQMIMLESDDPNQSFVTKTLQSIIDIIQLTKEKEKSLLMDIYSEMKVVFCNINNVK